jgi:hypothetical protein
LTTARFYATDYDHANPDSWINPANIVGAADEACTEKTILTGSITKRLRVYFTINLPPTAIIDDERANSKGTFTFDYGTPDAGLNLVFISQGGFNMNDYFSVGKGSFACAGSQWGGTGLSLGTSPYWISLADLNSGNFTARIYVTGTGLSNNTHAYLDSVYLEIDYHLPSVGGMVGDGLTLVALLRRRRRTTKPPLGFRARGLCCCCH